MAITEADTAVFRWRGEDWRYAVAGSGHEDLVLLVGGFDDRPEVPESLRPVALAGELRIWAITYPPLRTMDEVVDGLSAFLEEHDLEGVHLFGASFGGAVAQRLVRRQPGRVVGVILANTAAPLGRGVVRVLWRLARVPLAILPERWITAWVRRRLARGLAGSPDSDRHRRMLESLTRRRILSLGDVIVDFHTGSRFRASDLDGWPGRMLILESTDDPMVPPAERRRLKEMYPRARVHTFEGGGHTPALSMPDEFRAVLEAFLADAGAGGGAATGPTGDPEGGRG